MSSFHMTVGLVIVALFLVLTVMGFLRMRGGGPYPWPRGVAFAAAGLLLLQYVLGFYLLADDRSISATHYLVALLAILPVGAEHMLSASKGSEERQANLSFVASLAALVLVLIAYGIGEANG